VETNGWNIPTQVTFIIFRDPLLTIVEKQEEELLEIVPEEEEKIIS
jgi:hypothetical protein